MNILQRLFKWVVLSNLYIAAAAACFQGVYVLKDGLADVWNPALTVHTFFSTWMVYLFSRWSFHRSVPQERIAGDDLYEWQSHHRREAFFSMLFSAAIVVATFFFLRLHTLLLLAALGFVSMIYPLQGKSTNESIRGIPYLKIFLIGLVWAGMSVLAPLTECERPLSEGLPDFFWHFFFILFITLPFDMIDLRTDVVTHIRTLPAALGWGNTQYLMMGLAVGLSVAHFPSGRSEPLLWWAMETLLLLGLAAASFRLRRDTAKWKVMAVYDGSMILLFILYRLAYVH